MSDSRRVHVPLLGAADALKDFFGSTPGKGIFGPHGGPWHGTAGLGAAIALPWVTYNLIRNRQKGYKFDALADALAPLAAGLGIGAVANIPEFMAKPASYLDGPYRYNSRYVPTRLASRVIAEDPYLSYEGRKRATAMIEGTGKTMATPRDLATVAAGAGLGHVGGAMFGNALGNIFGGTTTKQQKTLQGLGVLAGSLIGAGLRRGFR